MKKEWGRNEDPVKAGGILERVLEMLHSVLAFVLWSPILNCECLAQQGDNATSVASAVRDLRSDDVAKRNSASATLKALPSATSAVLKRYRSSESDPEVRSRIDDVLRHWALTEASDLWRDGRMQESLLKYAEGEGDADPAESVQRRCRQAREGLISDYSGALEPGGKMALGPEGASEIVVRKYGRWAIPFLLDVGGELVKRPEIPAARLLEGMGTLALPPLCEALKSSNRTLQFFACAVIERCFDRFQEPKLEPTLILILKDPDLDPSTRERAQKMVEIFEGLRLREKMRNQK